MNATTLSRTYQRFSCVGELYETSLKLETTKIKLRDESGKEAGTTDGERIMGEIAVKTDNGTFRFSVYGQNLTSKGEPSKQWSMYTKMLEWNPVVNGNHSEPTSKVRIAGTVEVNDYVNKSGELSEGFLRWRVVSGKTIDEEKYREEVRACDLTATLMVGRIAPEMKDEKETGRLLVTFYGANGNGAVLPITAVVAAEVADAFAENYEKFMTASFVFTQLTVAGGQKKKKEAVFSQGSRVTNETYEHIELMCVSAYPPIEEPDELTTTDDDGNEVEVKTEWINPKAIAEGLKVRAEYLENLKKKGYQGKTVTKTSVRPSLQDRKQSARVSMDDDDFSFDNIF